ncbi:UNVERIFIED_CONTAM: hypothetical protein Sangu_1913000 [Sesamum angustifolium]|uniref:DOG1 domain-containing protein n=1 Tax=Sesamum angustifolium TaxID=2727405 RepID=A0AAW2LU97_9LAMI
MSDEALLVDQTKRILPRKIQGRPRRRLSSARRPLAHLFRAILAVDFRVQALHSVSDPHELGGGELSPQQRQRIEAVKAETRRKEREITQAMARVQETVAEQPVYSLMRRFGKLVDGEVTDFDTAMERLKAAMLVVVENADALQGWTAAEVVEILSPAQGVKFFAAVARFQLQSRRWGVEKDSERERMAVDEAFPPPA